MGKPHFKAIAEHKPSSRKKMNDTATSWTKVTHFENKKFKKIKVI